MKSIEGLKEFLGIDSKRISELGAAISKIKSRLDSLNIDEINPCPQCQKAIKHLALNAIGSGLGARLDDNSFDYESAAEVSTDMLMHHAQIADLLLGTVCEIMNGHEQNAGGLH